jgi:hypothetical protein
MRSQSILRSIKLSFVLVFLLLFEISASAYTLVLMSGRRVEIPDQFQLSATMLTYQVSPEIQVTLQLRTINIPATERANRETPGSFYKHATNIPIQSEPVASSTKATRTLTNRDLESYARVRRESAQIYEQRRKELGLPTVQESQQRQLAESESLRQDLATSRMAESEKESYWRGRASDLRSEIAAVDAEIGFVRSRLDELAVSQPTSYTVINNAFPLSIGSRGRYRQYSNVNPNVFGFPGGVIASTPRYRRNPYRGGIGLNVGIGGLNQYGLTPTLWPYQNLNPFGSYDNTYAREALVVRLDELVGRRAGLGARWRDLQEEARRAGAMPGWLRP